MAWPQSGGQDPIVIGKLAPRALICTDGREEKGAEISTFLPNLLPSGEAVLKL